MDGAPIARAVAEILDDLDKGLDGEQVTLIRAVTVMEVLFPPTEDMPYPVSVVMAPVREEHGHTSNPDRSELCGLLFRAATTTAGGDEEDIE